MRITVLTENHPARGAGYDAALVAEHGLSLHIEHAGSRVLFDAGASVAFRQNAAQLGIDLAAVDAAVISHHHRDHGGGLAAFLEANPTAPVYLRPAPAGQPYRRVWVRRKYIGLDRALLDGSGQGRCAPVTGRAEIAPGIHLLTDIGRDHPAPASNRFLHLRQAGRLRRDPFDHELLMVVAGGDGLVVVTGCSHRGVLNMIDAATAAFPGAAVKAVIGGFHLLGMTRLDPLGGSRAEITQLGRALLQYPGAQYYTGHCTCDRAYAALAEVMAARLAPIATGMVLEL
jgi:7,8-dihydropterin-6-yl-methyl-4-(beta-D-ribofuranosyl)aminobenzene 5'-phosphate synthase